MNGISPPSGQSAGCEVKDAETASERTQRILEIAERIIEEDREILDRLAET